jgi:putative serine protease PepD
MTQPSAPAGDDRPRTGGGRSPWWWAGLAAAVVVGGLVGALVVWLTRGSGPTEVCSATTVADKALPSVVTIQVRSGTSAGNGSGEIIRSSGEILTNNHVISAAASGGSIQVVFSDGATAPATIVGRDPKTDLAVIKVSGQRSHPPIALGSSEGVKVGQPVVAIGAPVGLASTVTSGIVSALDRTVEVPADNGQTALLVSAVQTDAAINPGNSGGALADCDGKLIGVPTAGASVPTETGQPSPGNIGLGFAIPVDLARSVSDELIANGSVTHSSFGVEAATVSSTRAGETGVAQGLYLTRVAPGGPAAAAGLRTGDVITELDGQQATDTNQLAAITVTKRPGERVSITYERGGRSATTTVVLGAQP